MFAPNRSGAYLCCSNQKITDMENLEVGQTIWCKSIMVRRESALKMCTVSKIGRVYFEVAEMPRQRFFIKTLRHDAGKYMPKYQMYMSDIDYFNEVRAEKLHHKIYMKICGGSVKSIELEKLEQIAAILGITA